jgi:hypothetical protein
MGSIDGRQILLKSVFDRLNLSVVRMYTYKPSTFKEIYYFGDDQYYVIYSQFMRIHNMNNLT